MRKAPLATLLWTSAATSSIGDGIRVSAFPLLAVAVTRDPVAVTGVTAAQKVPQLLFGMHVGAFVDRADRISLVRNVQLVRLLLVVGLVALVATDSITLWALYVLSVVLGIAELLADTALQALTPEIVADQGLEHVNSRLSGAQSIGEDFAGPALGGVLFGVGRWLPFTFDAATFAVSAALFERLRARLPERRPAPRTGGSLTREAVEGFHFLVRQPVLRSMALWVAVINGSVGAATATFVLYATDTLDVSATVYGVLLTGTGVGALLGAVVSSRVVRLAGRAGTMFGASVLAGAATLAIGVTHSFWLIYALQLLTGLAGVSFSIVARSLRQSVTPIELMGRVTGMYRLIGFGTVPAGAIAGGFLARQFTLGTPFVVAGAAILAGTLTFGANTVREHRRAGTRPTTSPDDRARTHR
ncbi:MFS transporter [Streptomyces sp. NPDC050738]|uniref:MFS transporter n=1 Tax=Streptomyces sp. NPDC050738 TaxID=3154744 RepID=UPI00341823DC